MKAEHRHQLQTNLLADRMGRLYQSVKSTPRNTSTMVWVFMLLALATLALWQYWGHATQTESSAQWIDVNLATHDPRVGLGRLKGIANEYKGSMAGRAANFQTARFRLHSG